MKDPKADMLHGPRAHCPRWTPALVVQARATANGPSLDRDGVIRAINELNTSGADLSYVHVARTNRQLERAAIRHFRSWGRAVEAAGLDYGDFRRQHQWTPEKVADRLRERQAAGEDLSPGYMAKSNVPLYQAAQNHFGSYRAAVEAAGIHYEQALRPPPRWPPARILEELRRLHEAGADLSYNAMRRANESLLCGAQRQFGTYRKAVQAAGISYGQVARELQQTWDRDKIVATLRRLYAEGADLSYRSLCRTEGALVSAISRYFQNYRGAIEAAGIPYEQFVRVPETWDREKILRTLRELYAGGTDLSYTNVQRTMGKLLHPILCHFGTYREAVEAAGIDYNSVRRKTRSGNAAARLNHWTEESVIQTIREMHAEGRDLRHRSMKLRSQPLFFAAKELFGTYVNAVGQAGIDYWTMSQEQLAKERGERAAVAAEPREPEP